VEHSSSKEFLMRRFLTLFSAALAVCVLAPALAQAQIYIQPGGVYAPPFAVTQSYYAPSYYYAPPVSSYHSSYYPQAYSSYYPQAYSSYYPQSYSYYPSTTVYSAPAAVVTPGYYESRTYQGFGIFRPRGTYTQWYYR
jgi:hypothetical protein